MVFPQGTNRDPFLPILGLAGSPATREATMQNRPAARGPGLPPAWIRREHVPAGHRARAQGAHPPGRGALGGRESQRDASCLGAFAHVAKDVFISRRCPSEPLRPFCLRLRRHRALSLRGLPRGCLRAAQAGLSPWREPAPAPNMVTSSVAKASCRPS